MSIARKAAKSGTWFAAFRFVTQAFSWFVTVAVARLLSPDDYGLMALASIITGYVEIFSELGMGAAIIQRETITQKELSSNFWFSMAVGFVFSVVSFGLAYPTAWFTNEPRVIPITQLISVLFVIGALMVVPFNILMRDLRFKAIGIIQLTAVVISSLCMLWMARHGFGVWTLIGGTMILRTITVILVFFSSGWKPGFHFSFHDVRPYLKFGLNVAGARSLFYIFQKSDKLIVGRILGTHSLGYYSLAMELASIPTDKIVSLVNQVSFPVFSRFQNDLSKAQDMYLRITKYIALFVSPLYLGGAYFGDEIIRVILGEKWMSIAFLFKIFCLSQFVFSMTSINSIIHNSAGRAQWVLYFYLVNVILMPASIYLAAQHGLNALAIPWITVYPLLCAGWTWITLRKFKVGLLKYMTNWTMPFLASILMIAGVRGVLLVLSTTNYATINHQTILAQEVVMGALFYFGCLFFFEKKTLVEIRNVFSRKGDAVKVSV